MIKFYSPFHLVEFSPWPIMGASSSFMITMGLVNWFHNSNLSLLLLGLIMMFIVMIFWWKNVIMESLAQGFHGPKVLLGLRWGMILFITSEVCFFFAFFWAFFHNSLAPSLELGAIWPPVGISIINPFSIPLLNTAILLSSGVTITWAHHSLMKNSHSNFIISMIITISLGVYFTFLQLMEYKLSLFSIADSIYGSTFFVATGFHGLHVLIGSMFLTVCLLREFYNHYSSHHHFGFEASAWYWHFVDVVWIFLYISIYWWGSL